MQSEFPLSLEEFRKIYSKVTRLAVEVLIFDKQKGVFMTLRDIEPCTGLWHLPGGTVLLGEKVTDCVKRIAKREVAIEVKDCHLVGYIEYQSHFKAGIDYAVGLVFQIDECSGTPGIGSQESTNAQWFTTLPKNMHPDQDTWLVENSYIEP